MALQNLTNLWNQNNSAPNIIRLDLYQIPVSSQNDAIQQVFRQGYHSHPWLCRCSNSLSMVQKTLPNSQTLVLKSSRLITFKSSARLQSYSSVIREAVVSPHNWSPPLTPRYHCAVTIEGFQRGPQLVTHNTKIRYPLEWLYDSSLQTRLWVSAIIFLKLWT